MVGAAEAVTVKARGNGLFDGDVIARRRREVVTLGQQRISLTVSLGDTRPVIFLHGNSSGKLVWTKQMEFLETLRTTFVAPDFPGHGESSNSESPASTYSFPGYAEVIRRLLDCFRWDSVDVVGWSLGGHVGLELLATEPRVRSLLIVGTPPVRLRPESLEEAFFSDERMQLAGKADFTERDVAAYGSAMMGSADITSESLITAIRRADGLARRWMFTNALQGIGIDQRQTVEVSNKPLCVVHGEAEPFVRLDYLLSLTYRRLWRDHVHVIRDSGHAPHWQKPQVFNVILADFLGLPWPGKNQYYTDQIQLHTTITSRHSY